MKTRIVSSDRHRSRRRKRALFMEQLESRINLDATVGDLMPTEIDTVAIGPNPPTAADVFEAAKNELANPDSDVNKLLDLYDLQLVPTQWLVHTRGAGSAASAAFEAVSADLTPVGDSSFLVHQPEGFELPFELRSARASDLVMTPVFAYPSGLRRIATDQAIVALTHPENAKSLFDSWGATTFVPLRGSIDQFVLTLPLTDGLDALRFVERLSDNPEIQWAQPNFLSQHLDGYTPNDPLFYSSSPNQWYLSDPSSGIKADESWNLGTGNETVIAIVELFGAELDHPDLPIWTNPGECPSTVCSMDGVDNDGNGWIDDIHGINIADNNGYDNPNLNDPSITSYTAPYAHGTAVSGVAGATHNNSLGVTGVSPAVKLMIVRIASDAGLTTDSAYAEAVRYTAGINLSGTVTWRGADVANYSHGISVIGTTQSSIISSWPARTAAYEAARNQGRGGLGLLEVVLAGNHGTDPNCNSNCVQYPAFLSSVMAVGSTDQSGARASFSNPGPELDLVTPGVGIVTTDITGDDGYNSYLDTDLLHADYASNLAGTSLSAPQVAAAAAMMLAQNPNLTATQLQQMLQTSAGGTFSNELGYGRLNVAAALRTVDKLEAHWKLEGNGTDSSPNGAHPATLTNVTFSTGQPGLGQAANIDDGRVLYAANAVATGPEWTVASWFTAPVVFAGLPSGSYLSFAGDGTDDRHVIARIFGTGSSGVVELGTYVSSEPTRFITSGFNLKTLSAGWHHLAAVGEGGQTRFFIDGQFVGVSASQTQDVIRYINAGNLAGSQRFSPKIDDVRIYQRALTESQISDLYGQLARWEFEQNTRSYAPYTDTAAGAPNQYHGGTVSINFTDGPNGHGRALLIADNQAPVELQTAVDLDTRWTIAGWFQGLNQAGQGSYLAFAKSANGASENYPIIGYWESATTLRLGVYRAGIGFTGIAGYNLWNTSTQAGWHHIAAVQSPDYITFFVDGVQVGQLAMSITSEVKYLGSEPLHGSDYGPKFSNAIDDVRIYNRDITPSEIRDLAGLAGKWTFDISDENSAPARQHPTEPFGAGFASGGPYGIGRHATFTGTSHFRLHESIDLDPNDLPTELENSWTVAARFQGIPESNGSAFQALTDGLSRQSVIAAQWVGANLRLGFWTGSSFQEMNAVASGGFDLNQVAATGWHHIAAVGESTQTKFYFDGEYVGYTGAEPFTHIKRVGGNTWQSAGSPAQIAGPFANALDDVRIYTRGLTAPEVRDLAGLIGRWQFEDNGVDSSSSAIRHDGSIYPSTTYASGPSNYGKALQFPTTPPVPGTNIAMIMYSAVDLQSQWTIGTWFNGLNSPGAGSYIVMTESNPGTGSGNQIIGWWENATTLRIGSYGNGGPGFNAVPNVNFAQYATGWHHLAAVGANGVTEFYVDGDKVGEINYQSTSDIKYVGSEPFGNGHRFANLIDDFRIYDKELTDSAIEQLYAGT